MNAVNAVLKTGRICLLDVDIQGVQTVKMLGMNAHFFFVKPPDLETLVRFINRLLIFCRIAQ